MRHVEVLCLVLGLFVLPVCGPVFAENGGNTAAFSMKQKEIDIRDALQTIARAAGCNIVMGPNVRGKISVELKDVPPMKAIEAVCLANGFMAFQMDRQSGIMIVMPVEKAKQVMQMRMMKRRRAAMRRRMKRGMRGGSAAQWRKKLGKVWRRRRGMRQGRPGFPGADIGPGPVPPGGPGAYGDEGGPDGVYYGDGGGYGGPGPYDGDEGGEVEVDE